MKKPILFLLMLISISTLSFAAYQIQMRRDTSANWTSNNPTLAQGEWGFETDTKKIKIGDGSTVWTVLAYYTGGSSQWSGTNPIYFSGNVGISTTVPPNALYVNGTIEGTGFKLDGNGVGAGYVLTSTNVGVGTWMPLPAGGTGTVTSIQYLSPLLVNGSAGGTITTSGNVGIGSTGTGNTFVLQNSPTFTGTVIAPNIGVGTLTASAGLTVVGNVGIGTTANQTALSVMNGNVGIGTWAPTYPLQVLGNFQAYQPVVTVTAGATPTIVAANGVDYEITGLATAITSMSTNLSGTTTNGAIIEIDITDNATPQGLTFGTSFESTTVTLPTTTVASTRLRLFFQYNSTSGKWSLIGMA